MRSREIILLTVACAALNFSAARAQSEKNVVVHGVPVRITGEFPHGMIVTVGERVVIRDKTDRFVYVKGIFEGDGRSYVVIAESSGGNGCPELYQAIDMTASELKTSPSFGTCSDLPAFAVRNGTLTSVLPRMDGKGNVTYSFNDGVLHQQEQRISLVPTGPATVPEGDLAAFALSKRTDEIFKLRATAQPLMRIMPAKVFAEARDIALAGPTSGPEAHGDFVTVSACEPHNCGSHQVTVAFDHAGHAWASIVRDDDVSLFGDPPPPVRSLLGADPR